MDYLSYIVTFVIGLLAGYSLKFVFDFSRHRRTDNANSQNSQGTVDQQNNRVGGNLAGRDVNVKKS